MATKTNLNTLYLVNDSTKKVSLEITVGEEGQTALLTVRLGRKIILENHSGNLSNLEIGKSNELNGKVLKITATITDTSRKTNVTFLNIKMSGGVLARSYPLYKTVENEGDSANYYAVIEFYKP
ncbi:hypothetical protein [Flavobacterium cyclinae]|jgi:hypothetical protein|uniref:hypothetical protein n=1 Tax=Flavobacterium cyclinae TaxID=2895947 RepID=UPI001E4CD14D|nr:hypothetical protein [Flavobacterium cyclinae]UGS22312.1 hypothetical protein LOS86_06730 [Flavobacterium cyclinae]